MNAPGGRSMREIGEFGFIEMLRRHAGKGRGVELGIGDDAAVLRFGRRRLLLTTDMILEGVHFQIGAATGFEIGWKALAVNVSDIAAMGGVPAYAVTAIGVPPRLPLRFVREIYAGLRASARLFRVSIVGGDTNASEKLVLSVALLGETDPRGVARRSGAKPGDTIFVSGVLGGSYDSKKHLRFIPRMKEARFLMRHFKVHAMMDISDGLASDIRRICERSGTGARLEEAAIPRLSDVSLKQALCDGEDFELLFTLSPKDAARLRHFSKQRTLAPFHAVGTIMPDAYGIRLVGRDGRQKRLSPNGFDHFK